MGRSPSSSPVRLDPRRVTRWLSACVLLLFVAGLASALLMHLTEHDWGFGLIPKFYMDTESGPATFFATLLLLLNAAALAVIAAMRRSSMDRFARHWLVLALGFLLMALDEAASFHELLIEPLRGALGVGGLLHYAWVVVGFAVVLGVGVAFLRFLRHLPRRTRNQFLLAALLYLGGALGVELFEGRHVEAHGIHNLGYGLFVTAEETLEMIGLVVFLHALLTLLRRDDHAVTFEIGAPSRES